MSFYCDCKKKGNPRKKDKCLKELIAFLVVLNFNVLASCCGHSKYPITIIYRSRKDGKNYEWFSNKQIRRKARFYKRDKGGYFYIPECAK